MDLAASMQRPDHWARTLGFATLAGAELGLIGPFGSYPANLYTRVAYWTVLFWIGTLIIWPSTVAGTLIGPRKGFPPLFSGTTAALLACIPVSALAAAGAYMFWPVHASGIRVLEWYGLTLIVALPSVAARAWIESVRVKHDGAALTPGTSDMVAAPLVPLDRQGNSFAEADYPLLPPHLLASALCLHMEDHHVRVHMGSHSQLYLGTLREVIGQFDPTEGQQVHRSWWVARRAVHRWEEDGRSVALILSSGLRVPVARNRVAILRANGWLEPAKSA